jgi:two-component system LytT family sensor kinase
MWITAARLRRVVRGYALSIAFWLAASVLVSYQTYDQDRRIHLPAVFTSLLLLYAIRYLTIAFLTPPIFYLVGRWPVTGAAIRRSAGYALGYLPFSLAFAVIRWLLLPPWIEETLSWGPRTLQTLLYLTYNTFADTLLLYLAIVVAAHAYTYFVRGQRQEIERLELHQALAQSELQALRAQLHPHFLFNTLQGVSTLIDTDRAAAQTMLLTLATLLRTALKHGSADLVTFREELDFVESYLDLEKMRLGRRLQVRWQIDPHVYGALIPQLLLQPLIENAVVHGIASSREGGWIEVQAYVRDGRLHVGIRNTLGGQSQPGLGLGIANTRARLRFLYAEDASFEFQLQRDAGVALASLALPAFIAAAAEKSPRDRSPADLRSYGER